MLKLLVTLLAATSLLTVFAHQSAAQAPVKQWDKGYGGSNFDALRALQQTSEMV